MLYKYNVFVYKNFLFFAGFLGLFSFNLASLLLNVCIAFFEGCLFFNLLKKNALSIKNELYIAKVIFFKELNTLYEKKLFLFGIGFKCWFLKNYNRSSLILLKLGFSRDICLVIPLAIRLVCLKPTLIFLKSNNKVMLEQFAARLCLLKKLNQYKGKGVLNVNKNIVLKVGKRN